MNFYGLSLKARLPAREQAYVPCGSAAGGESAAAEPWVTSARAAVGMYGVNVYVPSRKRRSAGRQRGWDHMGSNEHVCGDRAATHSSDHCGVRM